MSVPYSTRTIALDEIMELSPVLSNIAVAARSYPREHLMPQMYQRAGYLRVKASHGSRQPSRRTRHHSGAFCTFVTAWLFVSTRCVPCTHPRPSTPEIDSDYSKVIGRHVPTSTGPKRSFLLGRTDPCSRLNSWLETKARRHMAGMPSAVRLAVLDFSRRYLRRLVSRE